jgi:hypothetical protein
VLTIATIALAPTGELTVWKQVHNVRLLCCREPWMMTNTISVYKRWQYKWMWKTKQRHSCYLARWEQRMWTGRQAQLKDFLLGFLRILLHKKYELCRWSIIDGYCLFLDWSNKTYKG